MLLDMGRRDASPAACNYSGSPAAFTVQQRVPTTPAASVRQWQPGVQAPQDWGLQPVHPSSVPRAELDLLEC
jgi:hypothetical protein